MTLLPEDPNAIFQRAVSLHRSGDLPRAIGLYRFLTARFPKNAQTLFALGTAESQLGHHAEGIAVLEESLRLLPANPKAHNNIANALIGLNRFDEALARYGRATAVDPNYAEGYFNQGALLADLRRFHDALACLDKAVALRPDYAEARFMKAEVLLRSGDYEQGWDLYETRWETESRTTDASFSEYPVWTGEQSIAGKTVLITPEVGFGDFMLFFRYVPLLQQRGAQVVIYAPSSLARLFADSNQDIRIVEAPHRPPRADFTCPIMSLPRAFRTTCGTIPATVPYLEVAPERQAHWRQTMGQTEVPRVGVAWTGQANRSVDNTPLRNRRIPTGLLPRLLNVPVQWHSLQKEIAPDDAIALQDLGEVGLRRHELDDFSDTAALMTQLDLVISTDTAVANLAGALGKEVWVMLPYATDYRWGVSDRRTPWYPTATLFRQADAGDWERVIADVVRELGIWLQQGSSRAGDGLSERT
jgi:hypothetical protein